MRYVWFFLLLPLYAFGGQATDSLEISAEGAVTDWAPNSGGAVDAVNSTDGNYMIAANDPDSHHFVPVDMTLIPAETVIDSVVVFMRAQFDGFGTNKMVTNIMVSGTETGGTEITLTDSDVTRSESFPDVPGGSGWSRTQVNGLTIEIKYTEQGGISEAWCTTLWVIVHYTTVDANIPVAKHGPDGAAYVHSIDGSSVVHGR